MLTDETKELIRRAGETVDSALRAVEREHRCPPGTSCPVCHAMREASFRMLEARGGKALR